MRHVKFELMPDLIKEGDYDVGWEAFVELEESEISLLKEHYESLDDYFLENQTELLVDGKTFGIYFNCKLTRKPDDLYDALLAIDDDEWDELMTFCEQLDLIEGKYKRLL